jgi:sodium pump decarboxylase gamma subunit
MELLSQALVILALGMGLTFVFLYLVILAVSLTGRIVCRFEAATAADGDEAGQKVVAAIAAAVHEHEHGHGGRG